VQKDRCDAVLWCGLCSQLGCEANRNCDVAADGGTDGLVVDPPPKKSCCQAGSDDIPGLLIICMAVFVVVLRRRRVS